MIARIPLKGGFEFDALSSRARRVHSYIHRAGVAKKAKRQYNKRLRATLKARANCPFVRVDAEGL